MSARLLPWSPIRKTAPSEPPYSPFWEDVADASENVVPDAYALQLHTPAHAPLTLSAAWQQETTDDGYRLICARDPEPWIAERRPGRRALAAGRAEFDSIIARPINPPWTPRIHVHQSETLTELRADVDGLAQGMTGQHLDLLARLDGARTVDPPLCERMLTVVADGRARFPEIYSDLSGPVPWSDDVMVRIDYRGSRRDKLAQMVTYLADHPVWEGLTGELVAVPQATLHVDEPGTTGLTAELRLRDRERVPVTYYDPAETPSGLVDAMLEWAGIDDADQVHLSMWSTDREVEAARLRAEVDRILARSSNLAVVTVDGDDFRRVVFNRDCVIATVSCRDADDHARETDRFTDLFNSCHQWIAERGGRESGLVLSSWDNFLASGAEPSDTDGDIGK